MGSAEPIEVCFDEKKVETEKAWLLTNFDGTEKEAWVPKSLCNFVGNYIVEVPEWWLEQWEENN